MSVILSREDGANAVGAEMTPHVILSEAKDLKLRILRSFGVFAPQDDGARVIRSREDIRGGFLAALAVTLAIACSHQSNLPKLFPVPNAKLVADSGKAVELASMNGKVTVYDFIFTNCAGTCPMMTSTLRRVTSKIDKDAPVQFVSISVDPRRDTPAQLRNYAAKFRNDARWLFLTGDEKTIVDLSVNGFKLAAANDGSVNEAVLHSSKFAIADKHGVIRDYYGAASDDAVDHVVSVVDDLLHEN